MVLLQPSSAMGKVILFLFSGMLLMTPANAISMPLSYDTSRCHAMVHQIFASRTFL